MIKLCIQLPEHSGWNPLAARISRSAIVSRFATDSRSARDSRLLRSSPKVHLSSLFRVQESRDSWRFVKRFRSAESLLQCAAYPTDQIENFNKHCRRSSHRACNKPVTSGYFTCYFTGGKVASGLRGGFKPPAKFRTSFELHSE